MAADLDQSHLNTILSNMMEGVVAVDDNARVLFLNDAVKRIFEIDLTDVKGRHLLEVLRQNQLNALLQSVLQDQKPRTDEIRTFSPDEHIFEAIAAPLIEKGKSVGALLVLHDITRVRRLEQVRRDFIGNVSHELRTPLASIKGFAETLRTGAMDDPKVAKEFLMSLEKQTDNMTALVDDLLSLSAIESGRRPPKFESVPLAEAVAEILKDLGPIAKRKEVVLSTTINEPTHVIIVDRDQLKQILVNLVENAIKFNQEKGWVKLNAIKDASHMKISVTDSGSGIPAQDIPRIFERFYRVDKARSRNLGGTGLGLAIVKHLVESNNGTVSVESSVGKGSTFTVIFPCA